MMRYFGILAITALFLLPLSQEARAEMTDTGISGSVSGIYGPPVPGSAQASCGTCGSCGGGSAAQGDAKPRKVPGPEELEKVEFIEVIDEITFLARDRKTGDQTPVRLWGLRSPAEYAPGNNISGAANMLEIFLRNSADNLACKPVQSEAGGISVMHCFINGIDVASMMVQIGYAKDDTKYSGGYYQPEETRAKGMGRGIWQSSQLQ